MFQPRPDSRRGAVREVLRETANLINGNEPLETVLEAVCSRLLRAADAAEVTLALADSRGCTVRWRRSRSSFTACEDVVDDAVARAVLADGIPRVDLNRAYAPLHDDGRVSGAVWMTSRRDVYDEDALALCDAFAGYLSLALQKAALRERARHLEELTVVDALTGVPNRRAFDAALEREWTRAIRAEKADRGRAARHRLVQELQRRLRTPAGRRCVCSRSRARARPASCARPTASRATAAKSSRS